MTWRRSNRYATALPPNPRAESPADPGVGESQENVTMPPAGTSSRVSR
jgi:hypothetical protein